MLTSKTNLGNLKTKIGSQGIDKLKAVPANLIKLSNVTDDDVKKNMYDQLVIKINDIDTKIPSTTRLVTKKQYDSGKQSIQKKLRMLTERYPVLLGWLRRLTATQKSQRLKTRY